SGGLRTRAHRHSPDLPGHRRDDDPERQLDQISNWLRRRSRGLDCAHQPIFDVTQCAISPALSEVEWVLPVSTNLQCALIARDVESMAGANAVAKIALSLVCYQQGSDCT